MQYAKQAELLAGELSNLKSKIPFIKNKIGSKEILDSLNNIYIIGAIIIFSLLSISFGYWFFIMRKKVKDKNE